MEQTRYLMAKMSAMICCMVLFCSGFTACSNDDDPVVTPSNPDNPTEEPIDTARYTIIVYGNAGGNMDNAIEHVFEETKPLIKLGGDVRLIYAYKYGKDFVLPDGTHWFTGKYADPGSIAYFEMHDGMDLEKIRENSANWSDFPLYEPSGLTTLINNIAHYAPARDYIFVMWGHGGGFDASNDIPWDLKLPAKETATRGVIYDEELGGAGMDMYEFSKAIEDSDIDKFKCIFLHNCSLGNLETLTQIQSYAEYMMSSAHVLYSGGEPVIELVRGITEGKSFESSADRLFAEADLIIKPAFPDTLNGDMNMLRSEGLTEVNNKVRSLANWLCWNYPTQKDAIDRATDRVYGFNRGLIFYDVADYADKLYEETADEDIGIISRDLHAAFNKAFVHRAKVDGKDHYTIPEFTLSTVLINGYNYYYWQPLRDANYSFGLIYSGTRFHQLTGWGNWLSMNAILPQNNPYGQD